MYPIILNVLSIEAALVLEVLLKCPVYVILNGLPAATERGKSVNGKVGG